MQAWKFFSLVFKTRRVRIFQCGLRWADDGELGNSTIFYMLVFDEGWELPSVVPSNIQRKALILLSMPPEPHVPDRDIVEYLKTLDLPATRISRRPSLEAIPLHYVYFVEAFSRNDSEIPAWRATVEKAIKRVNAKIKLIGIW